MFSLFGLLGKPEPVVAIDINFLDEGLKKMENAFNSSLNDQSKEAEVLFSKDGPDSNNPFLKFGKAIIAYQNCLMGFEESGFASASKDLLEAEREATKMAAAITLHLKTLNSQEDPYSRLIKAKLALDIVVADSLLMLGTLAFLSQSISEYARAAFRLKRSYDMYNTVSKTSTQPGFNPPSSFTLKSALFTTSKPLSIITEEPFEDFVFSGVSFGLGLFKLLVACLPKKAKSMLSGVGLGVADRPEAISYLHYSILFNGLHGSLSSLLLLSFYSGWVSFASHLPCVDTREFCEAEKIIPQIRNIYPKGKIWRLLEAKLIKLKGDVIGSKNILTSALSEKVQSWEELNYLILYELGWCEILQGNYQDAADFFKTLREETNWSKAFYCYLEALCHLRINKSEQAIKLLKDVPTYIKKKIGGRMLPVESFVKNRSAFYLTQLKSTFSPDSLVQVLPILEVTYFFNGFHFIFPELLDFHIKDLEGATVSQEDNSGNDELSLLKHLLLGTLYRELKNNEVAENHLNQALLLSKASSFRSTILSYGLFELAVLEFANASLFSPESTLNQGPVLQRLATIDRHSYQSELEDRLQFKMEWLREGIVSVDAA